jgi:hypothetical protein
MKTTIAELLYAAEAISHLPKIRDFEQDRFDALQAELMEPAWMEEVQRDLTIRKTISRLEVSPEVRAICAAEIEAGRKSGWRIR